MFFLKGAKPWVNIIKISPHNFLLATGMVFFERRLSNRHHFFHFGVNFDEVVNFFAGDFVVQFPKSVESPKEPPGALSVDGHVKAGFFTHFTMCGVHGAGILVKLSFAAGDAVLTITIPTDVNLCPVGFIVSVEENDECTSFGCGGPWCVLCATGSVFSAFADGPRCGPLLCGVGGCDHVRGLVYSNIYRNYVYMYIHMSILVKKVINAILMLFILVVINDYCSIFRKCWHQH